MIKQKVFGVIYRAINKTNGKSYVGKTKQRLKRRMKGHRDSSKTEDYYFARAIRKYGLEGFDWLIIEEIFTDQKQLKEREKYWIAYLNLRDPKIGYNILGGGEGNEWPEEMKLALSLKRKQMYANGELTTWNKGRKIAPKDRAKREIRCIETGIVYRNVAEAAEKLNIPDRAIYEATRKRCCASTKGYPDFEFLNPTYKKQTKVTRKSDMRYVKCLETGVIYNSIAEAARTHNLSGPSIGRVCAGERDTCKGLHWEYSNKEDYEKFSKKVVDNEAAKE